MKEKMGGMTQYSSGSPRSPLGKKTNKRLINLAGSEIELEIEGSTERDFISSKMTFVPPTEQHMQKKNSAIIKGSKTLNLKDRHIVEPGSVPL